MVVDLNFVCLLAAFWPFFCGHCTGGLLLSLLATTSTILDHYLRRINAGFAIGFTSVLIIVSIVPTLLTLGPVDMHVLILPRYLEF